MAIPSLGTGTSHPTKEAPAAATPGLLHAEGEHAAEGERLQAAQVQAPVIHPGNADDRRHVLAKSGVRRQDHRRDAGSDVTGLPEAGEDAAADLEEGVDLPIGTAAIAREVDVGEAADRIVARKLPD